MPETPPSHGVYGHPPADLVTLHSGARQFSPIEVGSAVLEDLPADSLDTMIVAAPPGTIERRHILALALRALKPGAALTVLAPKDKGGLRLAKELEAFGCTVGETSRRHFRLCETVRPASPVGIEAAIEAGALRFDAALGQNTQPGVFSFERVDPGSALLAETMPRLAGRGADLGCGIGTLSLAALASSRIEHMTLIDIDRRAVAAARRNVTDPRAEIVWADACHEPPRLAGLDFVVMNPPFHRAGIEDRALGQAFIQRAAAILHAGGILWMTANRHLPYEGVLGTLFKRVSVEAERDGFKIFEAQK